MQYIPVAFYEPILLCSIEAEATAGVGRPEDSLFGPFWPGISATGESATSQVNANDL